MCNQRVIPGSEELRASRPIYVAFQEFCCLFGQRNFAETVIRLGHSLYLWRVIFENKRFCDGDGVFRGQRKNRIQTVPGLLHGAIRNSI